MQAILIFLLVLALGATLVVVLIGILSMARDNEPGNAKRQNKLMQWRLRLQALALLIAFLAFAVFA